MARKKQEDFFTTPHWMVTYSDLVTLLLCFFVLIFSFAVVDMERFQAILASIQMSFMGYTGIMDRSQEPQSSEEESAFADPSGTLKDYWQAIEKLQQAQELREKVSKFLAEAGLSDEVKVKMEERGIVMELPDYIFFERARADLRPEAIAVLDKLAELFKEIPNTIVVEGHTCNLPMNTVQYPTNWELSVVRSVRVTRYLVEVQGIPPERFVATGYGEYQPLASNDTAEGRAANRRVTIVLSTWF